MSNPPAATRVFEIPELLEMILLRVAHLGVSIDVGVAALRAYTTRPHKSPRQLFALRKVNKTFKNTIKGSIQLARRMFLANVRHINYGNDNILRKYVPVLWLLNFLRKTDAFSGFTLEFRWGDLNVHDVDVTSYHCRRGEAMIGNYVSERLDKGASWRDMKASNITGVQRMSVWVRLKAGASSGTPSYGTRANQKLGHFDRRRNEDDELYKQLGTRGSYRIDGHQTLGDFFDGYVEALKELSP